MESSRQKIKQRFSRLLQKKSKSSAQKNITVSNDKIGAYPSGVHVDSLESRRILWTARAFAIAFFLSVILNIGLSFVVLSLFPLKTVEPMLLTFSDKSQQVVRIEPINKSVRGYRLLIEQALRDYVINREGISIYRPEMLFRWRKGGYVAQRSTDEVYAQYSRFLPSYRQLFERGIKRDIRILDVNRLVDTYWKIEFETVDFDIKRNQEINRQKWKANIDVSFAPQRVQYANRFNNPLGFFVTRYVTERTDANAN